MKSSMKILIDAGHGGTTTGASLPDGTLEDELNLDIALALEDSLNREFPDWSVTLTRRSPDATLSPNARLRMINSTAPDAFVSIHCNASKDTRANGVETLYRDDRDKPLAEAIQNSMLGLPLRSRGVKNDVVDLGRNLAVLNNGDVPSVLVEVGFMTNPKDLEVIQNPQMVAAALLGGIEKWVESYL